MGITVKAFFREYEGKNNDQKILENIPEFMEGATLTYNRPEMVEYNRYPGSYLLKCVVPNVLGVVPKDCIYSPIILGWFVSKALPYEHALLEIDYESGPKYRYKYSNNTVQKLVGFLG